MSISTQRRSATLAMVAASAGVSVATVSRVLNGRADVGAATRERVETLLRQHEYRGRKRAPVRRSPATARLELLLPEPLSAYSIEILNGVRDIGVPAVVGGFPDPDVPAGLWARDLVAAGREAVIAVVGDLTEEGYQALVRAGLPLVLADPGRVPRPEAASVGATNFAGGMAAAHHLVGLGHRRIAYVGGPSGAAHNQARLHGLRAALEAAGCPPPDEYVRPGTFTHEHGLVAGSALLTLPEPPTAIFAASDETASGVIEAARGLGRRVPEDVSVVGFDDTQVARFSSPPMTTIRQPLREMGRVAARTALRLAVDESPDSYHIELATELVVRRSTAPLR
ncbi:LacI family DNA-binding transcriptional regulator [Actinoplanes sp. NBRC 103695]|uniref:LacI family DNA-binding transcriptional regulator n=1 Tax=Actinoplanes sp. NBRC 103695 TaxID=3032202 RepID=UPI0024A48703|nr:LacI family DNA-binding transcriptional regulator [Actinoplanes sp. NBRC 103695]GLY92868.1 LacI family transcriptional regulator [Actinoplanes sp. NBRC 103695]